MQENILLIFGNAFKTKQEEEQKETITDANEFNKWVNKQETGINTNYLKNILKFKDLVICSIIYTIQMI